MKLVHAAAAAAAAADAAAAAEVVVDVEVVVDAEVVAANLFGLHSLGVGFGFDSKGIFTMLF